MMIGLMAFTACKNEEAAFQTSEAGFKYLFHRQNDTGYQLHYDEVAYVYLRVKNEQGQMLINLVDSLQGMPFDMMMEEKPEEGDIYEALTMMREGDSATFVMKAIKFFGPLPEGAEGGYPANLKADDLVMLEIGLQKVIPLDTLKKQQLEIDLINQEQKRIKDSIVDSHKTVEEKGMHEYFKKKGLSNYKTLPDGVMIAITKQGNGPKAEKGDRVSVEFNIKTLAGAEVMTTAKQGKPYTFDNLGTAVTGEVYGLHDAIEQMSEGGEATIAIPFMRGFGDRPMSEELPAYSTLVGTLKIVKVEKK